PLSFLLTSGAASFGLFDRALINFFQTRDSRFDLFESRSSEIPDTLGGALGSDVHRVAALQDDPLNLLGDRHHLIYTLPALVAVPALAAPDGLVDLDTRCDFFFRKALLQECFRRHFQRCFAVRAQSTRKPLSNDQGYGRCDR